MTKRTLLLPLGAALAVPFLAPRLYAQSGQMQIGPVDMTFSGGSFVGNSLHLSNAVMTTKDYELHGSRVVADFVRSKGEAGAAGITRITADGNPATGTQVTGRFTSLAEGRTYRIRSDHAVYVPVPGRKGGGQMDFTGHVVVVGLAPEAIDGPATFTVDKATVLLGAGPQYPQVNFGGGHLTFTPLSGSK